MHIHDSMPAARFRLKTRFNSQNARKRLEQNPDRTDHLQGRFTPKFTPKFTPEMKQAGDRRKKSMKQRSQ